MRPLLHLRRSFARRGRLLPAELLEAWAEPPPAARTRVEALRFLVCDAEMSGLDPREAELLSLAWVAVEGAEVQLASARQLLLRNEEGVGQSAAIHGLRDCELSRGECLEPALRAFARAAGQRVLVFHNAPLDMAFLNRAARAAWGVPLLLPWIDTLQLEARYRQRREQPIEEGGLRLAACRRRYGLAAHRSHSALTDAMATAELLLAQLATRGPGLRLRDL